MKLSTTTITAIATALVMATSAGAMTAHPQHDIVRDAALGEIGSNNWGSANVVAAKGFDDAASQFQNIESTVNTYAFAANSAELDSSAAGYGRIVR